MANNSKHYSQSGVSNNLEYGKNGYRIKQTTDTNALEVKNNADSAYANLRGANPVHDYDYVTKNYLEKRANVIVTGQIDGNSPPVVVAGVIYVVTTTGGTYTEGELYRGEDGSWVVMDRPDGFKISVADALSGGNLTFDADRLYQWDEDTTTWIKIGPSTAISKVMKSARASLAFNTSSPLSIGSALPANARVSKVVVSVTQVFDGTAEATLSIGDAGDVDRLMTIDEINLKVLGNYEANPYHLYGTSTQVTATYTPDVDVSQGTATIEVFYTIV